MNQQIVKKQSYEIAQSGQLVLSELKKHWGKLTKQTSKLGVSKTGMNYFCVGEVQVDSLVKKLNQGYPKELFYEFASKVEEEDEVRLTELVKKGIFDVDRANKSFSTMQIGLSKKVKPKTWGEANELDLPSINTVAIYKGEEYIEDVLFAMITKLSKRFGKRSDLDEGQIEEIVEDLTTNYRAFTIADYKYMFHHLESTSKKLFSLDYQILLQLIEEGLENKANYWEAESENKHKNITAIEKGKRKSEIQSSPSGEGQDIATQLKEIAILGNQRTISEKESKQKPKFKKQAK